jgi:hypothetical protein
MLQKEGVSHVQIVPCVCVFAHARNLLSFYFSTHLLHTCTQKQWYGGTYTIPSHCAGHSLLDAHMCIQLVSLKSEHTLTDAVRVQVHYSGPIFTQERSNSPLIEESSDALLHAMSPVSLLLLHLHRNVC